MISKQRNGPTGEVKLTFVKQYARFEDLAKYPMGPPTGAAEPEEEPPF